jgi:hypothetical protein
MPNLQHIMYHDNQYGATGISADNSPTALCSLRRVRCQGIRSEIKECCAGVRKEDNLLSVNHNPSRLTKCTNPSCCRQYHWTIYNCIQSIRNADDNSLDSTVPNDTASCKNEQQMKQACICTDWEKSLLRFESRSPRRDSKPCPLQYSNVPHHHETLPASTRGILYSTAFRGCRRIIYTISRE